jgi:hypothetical protein
VDFLETAQGNSTASRGHPRSGRKLATRRDGTASPAYDSYPVISFRLICPAFPATKNIVASGPSTVKLKGLPTPSEPSLPPLVGPRFSRDRKK